MTASLSGALASLKTSTSLLDSSLAILDAGISDLPRLQRVVAQTRHFELLPASTLAGAQASVLAELAPEVEALLARVEAHLERLERREGSLRARWELQEGRLARGAVDERAGEAGPRRSAGGGVGVGGSSAAGVDEFRARQMRQKKERLSYAVERLQLQAQQRQRQLRKSMMAQDLKDLDAGVEDDFDG